MKDPNVKEAEQAEETVQGAPELAEGQSDDETVGDQAEGEGSGESEDGGEG